MQRKMYFVFAAFLIFCLANAGGAPGQKVSPSGDDSGISVKHIAASSIKKVEKGYNIEFTVKKSVDVTIRIVDSKGEVVRHLASGMVGTSKTPKPFEGSSTSQKILWDGKDDAGKTVDASTCKALIGAGINAKFDKFALWNPDGFGNTGNSNWAIPGSIAVNQKGEIYLVQQFGVHMSSMRVFDREGKFVKQVYPFSLDKSKAALDKFFRKNRTIWPADTINWGAVDWSGRPVPRAVGHSAFYWFSVRSPSMVIGLDGRIFYVDQVPGHQLIMQIDPEGLPDDDLGTPPWVDKGSFMRSWTLAVGPEGDIYIADNMFGVIGHLDNKCKNPVKSFTFNGEKKLGSASYMIGEPAFRNKGNYDPMWGIAVDKEGNIWLGDSTENCMKIYRKDGFLLGKFDKVKTTTGDITFAEGVSLAANHKTGAVYANIKAPKGVSKLLKFNTWKDLKVVQEIELSGAARKIAVDQEASIIWAVDGQDTLIRVTDTGSKFEKKIINGVDNKTLKFPGHLTVDSKGRMYIRDASPYFIQSDVDGNAFKKFSWWGVGTAYIGVDKQDNFYTMIYEKKKKEIWKFTPDGKRAKFGTLEAISIENVNELKGIDIAANGDIYCAITEPQDAKLVNEVVGNPDTIGDKYNFSRIDVYGADGILKKNSIVKLQGPNDVKLDRDGNIYTIETGTCHGAHKRRAAKLDNLKFTMYNKLMKFSPTGGIRDKTGHIWTVPGNSGTSSYTCGGECPAAEFMIDADNLIWLHDQEVFNVLAVDTAGNIITRIGAYGNEDNKGGGNDEVIPGTKIVKNPEIPLSSPYGVAVWKNYLLISDMFTHRILRCKLDYTDKTELTLPK